MDQSCARGSKAATSLSNNADDGDVDGGNAALQLRISQRLHIAPLLPS